MASTPVKFTRAYDTALTAKLVATTGTGTPAAGGYACTNANGLQTFTVTQALVGEFYLYAHDSASEIAWQGFVDLLDDTATYYSYDKTKNPDWNDGGRLDLILDAIKLKADLLGTGSATVSAPVTDAGVIERIVRGADYKTVNSRDFVWTIADPGNIATPGSAVCTFAARKLGEASTSTNKWSVTGTVADAGGGNYTLTFELADTDTDDLDLGDYEWSVEVVDDSGNKIVPALTDRQRLTRLVEKFS